MFNCNITQYFEFDRGLSAQKSIKRTLSLVFRVPRSNSLIKITHTHDLRHTNSGLVTKHNPLIKESQFSGFLVNFASY